MDDQEQNLRRRYNGDEGGDNEDTVSAQSSKPLQEDKVYERIRGHERHILFHFFTLFSISFLIGVVFLHLSLWMNANFFSPNPLWSSSGSVEVQAQDMSKDPDNGAQIETVADKPLWNIFEDKFYYTGEYFLDNLFNGTKVTS